MLKYIKGDLIELADNGKFTTIIHGCNCFHTMGAGIAKQIRYKWIEAYLADLATPYGNEAKLGATSRAIVTTKKGALEIINAYTQFDYRGKSNVNYEAIRNAFRSINVNVDVKTKIGIPKIGCGLAGGDWNIVSKIIEETCPKLDITVVEYEDNRKQK